MQCNGLVVSQTFTDGLLTIQNGDILNIETLIKFIFTDNILTITNGYISNVTTINCNGNILTNSFTDNILNINQWRHF